jgi:hypothetical protein
MGTIKTSLTKTKPTEKRPDQMNRNIETIVAAYFAAVFFTDAGDRDDILTGDEEISDEAQIEVADDVNDFLTKAETLLTDDWSDDQIGHDLWMTRNGHGVGFWDRDFPNRDELSNIAKEMGERWPYAGDDGLLYFSK